MGRKANNLPIRLARKKKIKDKSNLQIQGRAGLGRRREKGREEQRKSLQKRGQKAVAEAPAPKQLSYLDLAKQQEEQAAKIATQEAVQPVQPSDGKKGKKKKRKRPADGTKRTEQWERSHVLPKADLRRDDTVQFGAASEAVPEADGSGPSPFPLVAAAGSEVVGSLALLCDLKAQPELNGQLGTLMHWDEGAGRWHVRLQDSEKRLKPENLALKALLRPGVSVRLRELRGSQELNGKLGICRAWNSEKLRWLVAVESHGEVLLKAENLEVALKPGLLVSLFGLKSAALNGREAVCLAPRGDRWHVRLENGEEKALRPSNLAVLAEQEPAAICPAVSQTVEVCAVSDRIPRLLQLMREVQESEKKGFRTRSLTLVLCGDTESVQKASAALADRQLACIKLVEAGQQERAKRDFGLDGKRILVATDSALRGLRLPPEVSRLVSLDLPDLAVHQKRSRCGVVAAEGAGSALLESSGEAPGASFVLQDRGGSFHAFLSNEAVAPVARELRAQLRRVKAKMDPSLEALAVRTPCGRAASEVTSRRARRPKRSKAV